MTINLLIILCQILLSTHAALVIEVQPSRIQPGLTNNLVINCSITDNKVPQMLKIYSLALARVISSDNDTLEELIVLNYNENNSSLKTNRVPEGSVGFNDASHISLSWPNPSYRDANRYKCEARGLSHNFNKISAAAYLSVETDVPDIKGLVDELFHLRKESYQTVNALKEVQERCRPQNDASDKSVNKLIAQQQLSMTSLFYSSNQYKGRRYYLSRRQASVEINIAQATCVLYGGYLAEIDHNDEFNYIVNFIKPISAIDSSFSCVYSGIMDPELDGVWTYMNSKNTSSYLPWGSGEPQRNSHFNCLCLEKSYNWRYNDLPCYYSDSLRYLCEVPVE
ncbi:C-type lectin domain family 3 member A-like isoform X2 [Biomphalaria pfeifferi]|uniref:C-type lectin domain family 3 member A-like isoform X2 n=1 Tax=Biomphalaria pfeifferi TaxID=112525 RepID=A0AAD8C2K8_BIOPF|nr:C-type lectin domain family 3 member A-like isoform X2 [Biomphalaria pfeifferi]